MENFNYQSVPFHYLHCLNPSCARSASCLRHLAAQHVPAEVTHIMAVNPVNYPAEADRCAYFRSTEKQRYAWGISSLFDNIPYKKAVYLKRKITNHGRGIGISIAQQTLQEFSDRFL